MYICGDFNIDLMKQDTHSHTTQYLDTMFSMGLYPLITKPSRITTHSATLIDNIFSNELKHDHISGLLLNDITDHLPVFTFYNYSVKRQTENSMVCHRNMDTGCLQLLTSELEMQHWEQVYSQNNVNLSYEFFLRKFETIVEKNCPMHVKKVNCVTKHKPWLTKGLINACKKKNALYVRSFNSQSQHDKDKYRTYKNKLVKILRGAERAYYNDQLDKLKHNIKATWKLLNEVIRGAATSSKLPDTFF